jgi:hypothetical protein
MIDKKSKELEAIGGDLKASLDIDKVTAQVEDTKGYTALFSALSNGLNENEAFKENPVTPEKVEVFFFSFLGIVFEMVAIFLFVFSGIEEKRHPLPLQQKTVESLSATKSAGNLNYTPNTSEPQVNDASGLDKNLVDQWQQPKTLTPEERDKLKKKRFKPAIAKIGFQAPPTPSAGIDREDLKKYVEYMYKHHKDNVSPGYRTIAAEIEIDKEQARKIKAHLEQIGVVKTQGTQTIIKVDQAGAAGALS